MAEYYYFAASLPMLRMDREAPMSYSDFMSKAAEHLSKSDYSDLSLAVFGGSTGDATLPIVREWQDFAGRLSASICRIRAERLGFAGYDDAEVDRTLDGAAREIVENKDPLEGEKAILSLYFDFLTSREKGSPFSSTALMIYALKLQILERANAFDEKRGRAEFDRLYKVIEGNIKR